MSCSTPTHPDGCPTAHLSGGRCFCGMHPCGVQALSLRPEEVERGDQFVGLRSIVEGIVFDGPSCQWFYTDRLGSRITTRRPWQTAQVLRGALSADDTPPFGVTRHLVLVGRTPDVDAIDATYDWRGA